jgi:hypothetical protein
MASAHTARLAVLACRLAKPDDRCQTASTKPCLSKQRSESEWAAVFPHIQRLYVHKRWKLRCVMEHMEEKYNFQAT